MSKRHDYKRRPRAGAGVKPEDRFPPRTIDPTPVYKRCRVRGCVVSFWAPGDILYCSSHRRTIEANAHYRYPKKHEREKLDRVSREGDWQLYDENHRLVWAKDLAARYKREMRRNKDGDRTGAILL